MSATSDVAPASAVDVDRLAGAFARGAINGSVLSRHESLGGGLAPLLDVALLRLLAEPLRAQIVALLAVEQLCTCHLVELTGGKQTNISNHLRALREAGLVEQEPRGRFTYYRLNPAALGSLGSALIGLADASRAAVDRRRPC